MRRRRRRGPGRAGGQQGYGAPHWGGHTPKCTVLLSFIQRNRQRLRAQGLTYLTVGFHVFQVGPRAGRGNGGTQRHGGAGGQRRDPSG